MERSATRDPHRGPTQGTHTEGTHTEGTLTGDSHRGPTQGTHTEERAPQDPLPEGRATQVTHTEHTQTTRIRRGDTGRIRVKYRRGIPKIHARGGLEYNIRHTIYLY